MTFLLDTNVISEHRKRQRAHPHVPRGSERSEAKTFMSASSRLASFAKGSSGSRARDTAQAYALAEWIEGFRSIFADRVIGIDLATADKWGRMNAVRPLPAIDSLMAASAKVNSMTFVTRDEIGLAELGVKVLNPFNLSA